MTEIVYHVAVSLDGFIATPDGGVGWLSPFEQSGCDHGYADFLASLDGLLFGRRTFEQVLTFGPWPYGDRPSWVFARSPLNADVPGVRVTGASPAEVAAEMAALGVKRAWLVGGGELAAAFRSAGLITEYRVAVTPILLGDGIPQFARGGQAESLRLTGMETFPTGIVMLTYRRA